MTKFKIGLGVFLLGLTIMCDSFAGTSAVTAGPACNQADEKADQAALAEAALKAKAAAAEAARKATLAGKTILVDAGHGGTDPGALRDGVEEKNITLDVSLKLRDRLEDLGAKVEMTRDVDVFIPLPDRLAASNNTCPDLFLSVHVNSIRKPDMTGVETYYYDDRSKALSDMVLSHLSGQLNETAKWSHARDLFVLNGNRVPATLAEIGYLTNVPTRAKLVTSAYQDKVATALADSVVAYLKTRGAERGCPITA